jgi:1-acyl-sn-glycerol-3-phosphate acyltransferase
LRRAFGTTWRALETLGRMRVELRGLDGRAAIRRRAEVLQRQVRELSADHRLRVALRGRLPDGPCVIVANHVSWLDVIALVPLGPMMPVAKAEIGRWPLLGAAVRALGVAMVDRGNAWSGALALRQGLRALETGVSVLGFPEGTTTTGHEELRPFKRGLFGLARIAGVPVVPLRIDYDSDEAAWVGDAAFLPHYLRVAGGAPITARVSIAPPLDAGELRAEALAALCRAHIGRMRGM